MPIRLAIRMQCKGLTVPWFDRNEKGAQSMKKLLSLALALMLCLCVFSGCAGKKYELALITDTGDLNDKSFNQGTWEGIVKYAEEKGISHQYYKPEAATQEAYRTAIDLAVKNGAKLIVMAGVLFEETVFTTQEAYPEVKFVLVDGNPHNADGTMYTTAENTVAITYAEQQSGFLAGYAAVKDGMTQLGFMGGKAVPAVARFGYGFVQGAEFAAVEMGLEDQAIQLKYHYTGEFAQTPEAQTVAADWYAAGVEVVFACGGGMGKSVMAAADAAGAKVIGVDTDQSSASPTVITSAVKGLSSSVYDMIKAFYDGNFPGGQNIVFDAAQNGVSLVMEAARFELFTQADYDAIFLRLANDTDQVSSNIIIPGAQQTGIADAGMQLTKVVVEEIK